MTIQPADRLNHVETYYFATKLAEVRKLSTHGEPVINLGIGSPDLQPPAEVIQALGYASQLPAANKYQSYKGTDELRQAFADFNKSQFGVTVDPDAEILPLIGSKEGIMHISMAYLNPGDGVLVPNPGYPSYAQCARLAGAEPLLYSLEENLGWKPDLGQLAQQDLSRVKLMWINYPNMPTGTTADPDFFSALLDFGASHNILICHDSAYSHIMTKERISLLQSDDISNSFLELQSLSKNFNMAGWRVGALISGSDVIDTVLRYKSNMDSGMYYGTQYAASVALGLGREWFDQQDQVYQERKEAVYHLLDDLGCEYATDTAGLFVWARIPNTAKSGEQFANKLLYDAKVFVAPGFIFGSAGDRYIRVSLCAPVSIIEEARHRIAAKRND